MKRTEFALTLVVSALAFVFIATMLVAIYTVVSR